MMANYFSISSTLPHVCCEIIIQFIENNFFGAILYVIAQRPMANAGNNNQVFFLLLGSELSGMSRVSVMCG